VPAFAAGRDLDVAAAAGRGLDRVADHVLERPLEELLVGAHEDGRVEAREPRANRLAGPLLARHHALEEPREVGRSELELSSFTKSVNRRTTVSSVSHSSRIERAAASGSSPSPARSSRRA